MANLSGEGGSDLCEPPHAPDWKIAEEFGLTAEDAECMKAQAAAHRAVAASGGAPMLRAENLARAVALESIAEHVGHDARHIEHGNAGEVVVRVPLDAPWKRQEVARASSDPPTLINAEASIARLSLTRDADCLPLAVDTAERHGVASPSEQMLAHQIAASHSLAMKLAAKSQAFLSREFLAYKNPFGEGSEAQREQIASIEASRLATAAARMMEATARASVVLDRLQHGIIQTVVVQQKVEVEAGGQALVNGAAMVAPRRSKKKRRG